MKTKAPIIAAALLGILVSGCLPRDPTVGQGTITLSPGVEEWFAKYKEERGPGHFAVSADGRHAFYNYCPDGRCLRGSKTQVIDRCEKGSRGSPCKIYGAHGAVVWENPNGQQTQQSDL